MILIKNYILELSNNYIILINNRLKYGLKAKNESLKRKS